MSRICSAILLSFLLITTAGCDLLNSLNGDRRAMRVAIFYHSAQIKSPTTGWGDLQIGELIWEGDDLRTGTDGYLYVQISDGSAFTLGPNTQIRVALANSNLSIYPVTLELLKGSLYVTSAVAEQADSLQIKTASGLASSSGGSMGIDFNPTTGRMDVTGMDGYCTLLGGTASVSLGAGQAAWVAGSGLNPSSLQAATLDQMLRWETYGSTLLTATPPSAGATALPAAQTLTLSPTTAAPTETPQMAGFPTARPTATLDPALPQGSLTAAESKNAGLYIFGYNCKSYPGCACGSPLSILNVQFSGSTLDLNSQSETITYTRTGPNSFTREADGIISTVTFYDDGFTIAETRDGQPCRFQTFIRP